MVKKFASLLINQTAWRLLCRSFAATLGLALVVYKDFSWWSLFIFFAVLFFVYFRSGGNRKLVKITFWSFSALSVIGLSIISSSSSILVFPLPLIIFCAVFTAFNFVILGIADSFFKDRFLIFNVTHTLLFLLSFLIFQTLLLFSSFWILAVFAASFLFLKDAFVFFNIPFCRKISFISIAGGVVLSEFVLLVRFLPLSFLSASVFAALLSFLLRDGFVAHLKGKLSISYVLREITIFILFTLIIFATAKWTI